MTDYSDKQAFIELMVDQKVLRFGEFELKSGRRSPYFFNLGAISDGTALAALGEFYAQAMVDNGLECDVLFGPAYKGIPIAVAMGVALARRGRGMGIGVAFDRKEAKDHGEGGVLVGAGLAGRRVLLVDDVVTDAATKRQGARLISAQRGELAGVLIALDRQEKLDGEETAFAALQSGLGVPVRSIATLQDVISWLDSAGAGIGERDVLAASIRAYRDRYCVLDS
ncbi:MAG: orotate phosphoribosyltransferase [Gammaproteobacteria bacterium]|nr:orotate phosphoribosyltransferase [Gammaproteobacteria bacterium]MDE0367355.1 orotate phosphoribosyltransferase [Gammaproteobacteria bacterium]